MFTDHPHPIECANCKKENIPGGKNSNVIYTLQYRHLIPAPVDRTSAVAKPSTSMTHVAWESKLCSLVRPSMHPCPGNWIAIGRAVVYYARAAHSFSAGIKCRHCRIPLEHSITVDGRSTFARLQAFNSINHMWNRWKNMLESFFYLSLYIFKDLFI